MGTWHLSSSFSQGLCFSFSGSQVPCWAFRHHISLPGGRRGKGVDVLLLDVSSSLEREAFLRDFCLSLAGRNWAMWLPQLQESWHSKDFTFPAIIAAEGRRERGCNGFQRPNLWCLLWVSISVPAIVPYASPTCHHGPLHSEDLPSSPSSALCLSPCLAPWSEGVPLWTLYFKVITLLIIPTLALFLLILSSRAIVNIWHSLSPYIYSNPNTSSEIYEFCLLFFFFLTDSASGSRFICANTTGGPQRDADRSSGVAPVLPASHWLTGASTLEPSWDPGHRWEPELEPGLDLRLGLGLWLARLWPLARWAWAHFPSLGWRM